MEYVAVSSSNIEAIGYDDSGRILGVRFHSGREYHYGRVPHAVFRAFFGAASKGQYFDQHVKRAGYPYMRVS
jgi:hypothetical protein